MTQGPEDTTPYGATPPPPDPYGTPPQQDPGAPPPPPPYDPNQPQYGQQPSTQPQYAQPQYTQPQYGQPQYGQPQYAPPPGVWGVTPATPYGVHPTTGIPYSEKSKIVAGLLQILLPLGIGRFYLGDTGLGVAQLIVTLVTCGIGGLWPVIDGIIILASDSKDSSGLMLRS